MKKVTISPENVKKHSPKKPNKFMTGWIKLVLGHANDVAVVMSETVGTYKLKFPDGDSFDVPKSWVEILPTEN